MNHFVYTGAKTREISFPLGGIGSGCIGLAGNGRLMDWEIFNRPNKGSYNGFSHFAVRAERGGKVIDARVLNSDLPPPYMGFQAQSEFQAFGFGPLSKTMAGMPHFRDLRFTGEFPIARIDFDDESFPGRVSLTAFNPLIPLNDKDSSIPAAFFEIEIANSTDTALEYTVAGTLGNPLPAPNRNRVARGDDGNTFLHMTSDGVAVGETAYGDLTIATDSALCSGQAYWYRGGWSDNLETYWRDFTSAGPLKERGYEGDAAGKDNNGTLAAHIPVMPGESQRVRFVVTWSFPYCENYWNKSAVERARAADIAPVWKNYYATVWPDSTASAVYCLREWDRLLDETTRFKEALFSSSLPGAAMDAVSATMSVLKSPTVLRLEDGTFYGWEGCHASSGCCEGTCTHVWNYAQALPFLFPALERGLLAADYKYNFLPATGGMPFRMHLPLGVLQDPETAFRPCADGQFGNVMKAYRDWMVCGDTAWLRRLWPNIKRSIEFAWHPGNLDRWDPDRTGVLRGRQHHTLDMELFGPNAWLTGFYLGALEAGARMAEALGEAETADEYRRIREQGKAWTDTRLFNGEYFCQEVDLADRGIVDAYDAADAYWDAEHGQIKYQIGDGCGIDQVLAQWHSDLYGLGEIFDPIKTRTALQALFRHNFKKPIRNYYNPYRLFCLNDEGGLVICDWPEGRLKPAIPVTYAQETMHGFEYAAAGAMIQNGLVDEGMTVVESVRERYDGERRNPWNEIECGSNYARSMASYALLNIYSGFSFDATRAMIGFDPIVDGPFRCFWSLDSAWGEYEQDEEGAEVRVLYGTLKLARLGLPMRPDAAAVGGKATQFTADAHQALFEPALEIRQGEAVAVTWG